VPESPNLLLRLSNGAENVVLVRQALSGIAEQVPLEAGVINDVRTAVTEACNNVSLHAYEGSPGPLEVEVTCGRRALEVVVRDHGVGIKPRIRNESENALGIGLAIIQSLSERVEFHDPPGGGTEVRMQFPARGAADLAAAPRMAPLTLPADELATRSACAITPTPLAKRVLPRVLVVLASHAGFTTDRIADVQMLADALASTTRGGDDPGEVRFTAHVERRAMELRLGPLPGGRARAMLDARLDGVGSVIGRISDEQSIENGTDARVELLVLRLLDSRA
jgi:serine/threonine-protein kinase RsbW